MEETKKRISVSLSQHAPSCPGTPGRYRPSHWSFHQVLEMQKKQLHQQQSQRSVRLGEPSWRAAEAAHRISASTVASDELLLVQRSKSARATTVTGQTQAKEEMEEKEGYVPDRAASSNASSQSPPTPKKGSRQQQVRQSVRKVLRKARQMSERRQAKKSHGQQSIESAPFGSANEERATGAKCITRHVVRLSSESPPTMTGRNLASSMSVKVSRTSRKTSPLMLGYFGRPRSSTDVASMMQSSSDKGVFKTWKRLTMHMRLPASPRVRKKTDAESRDDWWSSFTEFVPPASVDLHGDIVADTYYCSSLSASIPSPLTPVQLTGTLTVLIIGSECVTKSILIQALKDSYTKKAQELMLTHNNDVRLRSELHFVEVDNRKDDLWLSLTASAYVVLFNATDPNCQKNGLDCLTLLRTRRQSCYKPVFLVAMQVRKQSVALIKEAKTMAKRSLCTFLEFHLGSEADGDLLNDILYCELFQLDSPGLLLRTSNNLTSTLSSTTAAASSSQIAVQMDSDTNWRAHSADSASSSGQKEDRSSSSDKKCSRPSASKQRTPLQRILFPHCLRRASRSCENLRVGANSEREGGGGERGGEKEATPMISLL